MNTSQWFPGHMTKEIQQPLTTICARFLSVLAHFPPTP